MATAANEPGTAEEGARSPDTTALRPAWTRVLPGNIEGWMGLGSSTKRYWALNNLVFMSVLWIQFGLGMSVNLYAYVTRNHPGAGAGFFSGAFQSVIWAIAHGPLSLAVHSGLGVVIAVHSLHNVFWNTRWGTRGSAVPAGLGALFVWAAGINGAVFLNQNRDLNSFLMAVFFAAAMLCYTTVVLLLAWSPEEPPRHDPTAGLPARGDARAKPDST